MGVFSSFLEGMSGTSKQKYGESLYDSREAKKWKAQQDKNYNEFGTRKDAYDARAGEYRGQADRDRSSADRYRGSAEGALSRGQGDINRARGNQSSANALMNDRQHYSNLAQRAQERYKSIENARLEMQSLRSRTGRPSGNNSFTQTLLDAFKGSNDSNRSIMEANTATLAKTNPVAAAKMQQDFNNDTLKSFGKLKQQGTITQAQLDSANLGNEASLLMNSTSLLGQQANEDQMANSIHQGRIGNQFNAGNAALNAAGSEQGQAGMYRGLAGDMDANSRFGSNMEAGYEDRALGALTSRTSIANRGMEKQDKFRMSDAAARARVDSFNGQRANMGLQNTLGIINTGVQVAGAFATAGQSSALTEALGATSAVANQQTSKQNLQATRLKVNATPGQYGPADKYAPQPAYNSNNFQPLSWDKDTYRNEGSSVHNPYQPMVNAPGSFQNIIPSTYAGRNRGRGYIYGIENPPTMWDKVGNTWKDWTKDPPKTNKQSGPY